MNYKDCCRTCLGNNKEMRHFQTVISIAGADVRLEEILQKFYNYEITTNDSFPENICINCVHQLTVTYSFKLLIENSSKTLEQCLTKINSKCDNDNYTSNIEFDESSSDINLKEYKNKSRKTAKWSIDDDNDDVVFCVECKAKFNSAISLSEHCSQNHPVKSTLGRDCDYCDEKFEDFGLLIKHMKLHLKPYACDSCSKGFYTPSDLETHKCRRKQKNQASDKSLQQCEQCGKSYPAGYIKLHIKIHSKDTPYSCKYCPKKFKVRCSLNSHILWKHKKTKNYTCQMCNRTFVSASQRSSHIRKAHFKERKHVCVTCSKKFFQRSDMERHYLTHTGVKNFHCDMCEKSYQSRYGLNVHMKSHTHVQYSSKEKNLAPI